MILRRISSLTSSSPPRSAKVTRSRRRSGVSTSTSESTGAAREVHHIVLGRDGEDGKEGPSSSALSGQRRVGPDRLGGRSPPRSRGGRAATRARTRAIRKRRGVALRPGERRPRAGRCPEGVGRPAGVSQARRVPARPFPASRPRARRSTAAPAARIMALRTTPSGLGRGPRSLQQVVQFAQRPAPGRRGWLPFGSDAEAQALLARERGPSTWSRRAAGVQIGL